MLYIRDNLKDLFPAEKTIDDFLGIEGEVYRNPVKSRKTSRFERGGQGFFIKAHWGIGWLEILKNLVYLRLPVLGAMNEVRAIKKFEQLNIDTMSIVAYGEAGCNPATGRSFLITEELINTKQLDHWLVNEFQEFDAKSQFQTKYKLIQIIAGIAKNLHENGINHRDFYLCHFLARLPLEATMKAEEIKLFLIDLHRAQIRTSTPKRWLIKDIAGLYFSAMELENSGTKFTGRDYFRFIKIYTGMSLRDAFTKKPGFWQTVNSRAFRLYKKQQQKSDNLPA